MKIICCTGDCSKHNSWFTGSKLCATAVGFEQDGSRNFGGKELAQEW